jgi:hypothetical protein
MENYPYQVMAWRARQGWICLGLFSELSDAETFCASRQERFSSTPCVLMAFGHVMYPPALVPRGPVDAMEEEVSRA